MLLKMAAVAMAGCAGLGCGFLGPAEQPVMQTVKTVLDGAALVRARELGLCAAEPPPVALGSPEEVLRLQARLSETQEDLEDAKRALAYVLLEMAKQPPPPPSPPPPSP